MYILYHFDRVFSHQPLRTKEITEIYQKIFITIVLAQQSPATWDSDLIWSSASQDHFSHGRRDMKLILCCTFDTRGRLARNNAVYCTITLNNNVHGCTAPSESVIRTLAIASHCKAVIGIQDAQYKKQDDASCRLFMTIVKPERVNPLYIHDWSGITRKLSRYAVSYAPMTAIETTLHRPNDCIIPA